MGNICKIAKNSLCSGKSAAFKGHPKCSQKLHVWLDEEPGAQKGGGTRFSGLIH